MKTEPIFVDSIRMGDGRRQVDPAAVDCLAESMDKLGLLQPISVYSPDDHTVILVTGAHRVAAAKKLGWEMIDAFLVEGTEIDREMQEIAENLHRNDLTALERSDQIARWAELTAAKAVQLEHPSGGHQPHEKGVSKVARDLGLDRADVIRSVKVASLSKEAKDAARGTNVENNRSALLDAASKPTVAEQVAEVHRRIIAPGAKVIKLADEPLNDLEAAEKQVAALMSAWNKAGKAAREEFLLRIEQPVMDRQYA
jgi:ParB family chromosome partitioning protein